MPLLRETQFHPLKTVTKKYRSLEDKVVRPRIRIGEKKEDARVVGG